MYLSIAWQHGFRLFHMLTPIRDEIRRRRGKRNVRGKIGRVVHQSMSPTIKEEGSLFTTCPVIGQPISGEDGIVVLIITKREWFDDEEDQLYIIKRVYSIDEVNKIYSLHYYHYHTRLIFYFLQHLRAMDFTMCVATIRYIVMIVGILEWA